MNTYSLIEHVQKLRRQGKSIRGIAAQLGLHPSKIQRLIAKIPDTSSPGTSGGLKGDFVGREQEIAVLQDALHTSISGRGRLVLLTGEPGIGKTRLTEELETYARLNKVKVYRGRCYEETTFPPFWPWIQIIRSCVEEHRAKRLRTYMGATAAAIAEIVPEVRQKLPGTGVIMLPKDPSAARFQLFSSISALFKKISGKKPLLLILDNLQWADKTSLMLLEFLAEEMGESGIMILGVYRNVGIPEDHLLSHTIGVLTRHSFFSQIILQGLSSQEVSRFISNRMDGIEPSAEMVDGIVNRTEGNPLFVTHIVKELVQQDIIGCQPDEIRHYLENRIPLNLRAFITNQLQMLSPECRKVLNTASVTGRKFSSDQLQNAVDGISIDALSDALEEAVLAGIVELHDGTDQYQFTHALIQAVLLTGIPSSRAAALHSLIARVFENLYGGDAGKHAAELAYHFSFSSDSSDVGKAVCYYRLAGEQSLAVYAYEEAIGQFHRALALKGIESPDALDSIPDDETAEIVLNIARATAVGLPFGETRNSGQILEKLLEYFYNKKDMARVSDILEVQLLSTLQTDISKWSHNTEKVLAQLDPTSIDAGRLLCGYGQYLGFMAGDYEAAKKTLDRALTIARQRENSYLELRVLLQQQALNNFYWISSVDIARRLVEMARRRGESTIEYQACGFLASVAVHSGRFAEALQAIVQGLLGTERLRQRFWHGHLAHVAQWIENLRGDWEAARSYNEQSIKSSARNPVALLSRVLNEYETGDYAKWDSFIKEAVEGLRRSTRGYNHEYAMSAVQLAYIACLTGKQGWSAIITDAANVVLESGPKEGFYGYCAKTALALVAVVSNDAESAREWHSVLEAPFKLFPERSILFPISASTDRILGLLSLTSGEVDEAIVHFEDARSRCLKYSFIPQMGWSCYDFARALLLRGRQEDVRRASDLRAEALSVAARLGMTVLADKVKSLDRKNIPRPVSFDHHLTDREIEVIRLLARGRTNREIASELYISEHTAATHVRKILQKANLPNRAAAATFAVQQNLIAE
ncbi:MAG: AAA family ATPase [Dehalococcoidales bacterium]|nr:AAA family ATPase [Dehalococcoidales bacterium]